MRPFQFTQEQLVALSGPYVFRAWFVEVLWSTGTRYYHTGMGLVEVEGIEWQGVSDFFAGALVSLVGIEEPRFNTAPKPEIVFTGADRSYLYQVRQEPTEGVECYINFAAVDGVTQEFIVPLHELFRGRLTAPRIRRARTTAAVVVGVEEWDQARDFPIPDDEWSPAGQRRRYPGDKGFDYAGQQAVEIFKG